ncbi:MAG: HAD-IC family P-type ATPase [Thermoanaerobaculia bacterium]
MIESRSLQIPLRGLHCRSCAVRIERHLKARPEVEDAVVSAAQGLVEIRVSGEIRPEELFATIRAATAEPAASEISIPLAGIAGAEQQAEPLEGSIRELEGVLHAHVDLATGQLNVAFVPGKIDADLVRRVVDRHGWTASHPGPGSHAPDDVQEGEMRALMLRATGSALAAVFGTLIALSAPLATTDPWLAVIPPLDDAVSRLVSTTPVVAHSLLAVLTALTIGLALGPVLRGTWRDALTRVATGRRLASAGVLVLAIASVPALAASFRGSILPSFWTTALWAQTFFLFTLVHAERSRTRLRTIANGLPRPRLLDRIGQRPMRSVGRGIAFSTWTVLVTLVFSLLTAGTWLTASLSLWPVAVLALASILLVAAPGTAATAAPREMRRIAASLQARGALVASGDAFDRAADIRVIAFTWRGGVAEAAIAIEELVLLDGIQPDELIAAAAAACRDSMHPACAVLRERAGEVSAAQGDDLFIGNPEMAEDRNIDASRVREEVERFEESGRSVLLVARGRRTIGAVALKSQLREGIAATAAELRKRGCQLVLATGQTERAAAATARMVGTERFGPGLDGAQKAELVRQLQEETGSVAFVGDGGDEIARARAALGIVFDEAKAVLRDDVVLTNGDPRGIVRLLDTSRAIQADLVRRQTLSIVWHLGGFAFSAGALVALDLLPSPALAALAAMLWSMWSSGSGAPEVKR